MPYHPDLDAHFARIAALFDAAHARIAELEAAAQPDEPDEPDTPGPDPVPVPAMPGARGWTAINIQCEPHDLIAADKAAGIARKEAYHALAYYAHAEAPVSMSRPQPPMGEIMRLLSDDAGLILRAPINRWQFDEAGNLLSADYRRMLDEWVAAGGRIQFVHMWLGQENWPKPIRDQGPDVMRSYLRALPGTVADGWQRLGRWFAKQPEAMRDAVVALEIFNEPAIYDRALKDKLLPRADVLNAFVEDQIAIARDGMGWWKGAIMPTLFGYSSRTAELIEVDGIARLRAAFGPRLIWSCHRYSNWLKGTTPAAWKAELLAGLEPMRPDPIVITEINADLSGTGTSFAAARVLGEVAATGVGIGWFSGINFGAALVSFWSDPPTIRNVDRLAAFLDAATVNDRTASRSQEPFRVIRSRLDPRGGHDDALLRIVGAPGGDVIAPTEAAATLIYGNTGGDNITINPNAATWVFGQEGSDVIDASTGPFALLVMGDGDDTVLLGADRVHVHGAAGRDTFVLADRGAAVIDGFAPGEDRIDPAGLRVTVTIDGADRVLTTPGGGTVRLLGMASADLDLLPEGPDPDPVPVPQTGVPARPALPKTATQVHVGHSLTDPLFKFGANGQGIYHQAAAHMGVVNGDRTITKSTVPGAPMHWRWNNTTPAERLSIGRHNAMVITEGAGPLLQPYVGAGSWQERGMDESVAALLNWARNTWTNGGPGAQVFLWTTWPLVGGDHGQTFRASLDANEESWHHRQERANAQAPAGKYIYIIPGHRLMMRFYDDIQRGAFPGITDHRQLYEDDIHINHVFGFGMALLHLAVIYKENPSSVPRALLAPAITAAQEAYIKTVVWEVATTYARAGLGGKDMGRPGIRGTVPVPVPDPDPTPDPDPVPPLPGDRLPNPSVGINLAVVDDWTTEQPFIDRMKTARRWINGGGSRDWQEVSPASGDFGPDGWPIRIPAGADFLRNVILTEQPVGAPVTGGRYVLRWTGSGRVSVGGAVRNVDTVSTARTIRFDFAPAPSGFVEVAIHATNAADPVRFSVVHERHVAAHDAGALFNPDWLALVRDMRTIRFMDWQRTNNSPLREWAERPLPGHYSWNVRGVPLEVMIALANEIGADPWFCIPHLATADFTTRFATMVRDRLAPGLKAHFEWSNECWNWMFDQTHWCHAEGQKLWPGYGEAFFELYAAKSVEMARVVDTVFAGQLHRVVKEINILQGDHPVLNAPRWRALRNEPRPPSAYFNAATVTGYFGNDLFHPETDGPTTLGWLTQLGEAEAINRAFGYLSERVDRMGFGYYVGKAREAGLALTMYEGGSHAIGHGPYQSDARVTAMLGKMHRDPRMGTLLSRMLENWRAAGGQALCLYYDVGDAGKYGSWGHRAHLNDDASPRWAALTAFNRANPAWWN